MTSPFKFFAQFVAGRPRSALTALLIITMALGSGVSILGEPADNSVYLPSDSQVVEASDTLDAITTQITLTDPD